MDIASIARATIEKHRLLQTGDRLLIALSGGPDSVALLHVLCGLRKPLSLTLQAVYINHQIRPRAAAREEKFCERLCNCLSIPLTIVREDVPRLAKRERIGLEEAGRNLRYATFERLARQEQLDKIALGHHFDDRAETVLLRIIRGTGQTGLAGMPIKRGKIIRPLFEVTKADILNHLRINRLEYCRDRSNEKPDFARNFVRQKLLPLLRRRFNPQVDRALVNLSETAADEQMALRPMIARAVERTVGVSQGGKIELDRAKYLKYTIWLRRRLLRYCLGIVSEGMVDRETVDRVDRAMHEGVMTMSLPHSVQARMVGRNLVFIHGRPIQLQMAFEVDAPVKVDALEMTVKAMAIAKRTEWGKSRRQSQRVFVDWSKIEGSLQIRSIRPGDRFQPLGMSGRKKVGDYLTDRKVPKEYRDEVTIVADGRGIIWLVGYEIADRVKVEASTRKVLVLEVDFAKRALPAAV